MESSSKPLLFNSLTAAWASCRSGNAAASSHICVTICSSLLSELVYLCALSAFFSPASPGSLLERPAGWKSPRHCQGIIPLALHRDRDDNTVVHLGNPLGRPGRVLARFFLLVRP